MKLAIVLGTRPEIIKMSPVIKECERLHINYSIFHTGQHYDYLMDKVFFEELGLRSKSLNLNIGSGTHAETTGKIIIGLEKEFLKTKPDVVLVQGDTNTVLAGGLTSVKLHIKLAHIEAGLRSFDRRMPEEYNRIVVDHISDFLFAPTKLAEQNLKRESVTSSKLLHYDGLYKPLIKMTGNTIVDAINQNLKLAKIKSNILNELNLVKGSYFLLTVHREENVDSKDRLVGILKAMEIISNHLDLTIIFPIHPRTQQRIAKFKLEHLVSGIKNLKIIKPVGFFDMLCLEANSKIILTDSGGVQEEACSMKIPCVVLRDTSDRIESVNVGAALLAGCNTEKIFKCVNSLLNAKRNWKNPFGDGKASERIIKTLQNYHNKH